MELHYHWRLGSCIGASFYGLSPVTCMFKCSFRIVHQLPILTMTSDLFAIDRRAFILLIWSDLILTELESGPCPVQFSWDEVKWSEMVRYHFLVTDRVSTGRNAIATVRRLSVCLSVCFNSNFWTEWSYILTFCMCTFHDHSSPMGLKVKVRAQGQTSKVKVKGLPRSVWAGFYIEHSFLVIIRFLRGGDIYISRLCYDASVRLPVRLSVCLWRKCIGAL